MKGDQAEYLRIPRRADRIAADALAWLDGRQHDGTAAAPVFLYVQLMEPHPPYAPPAAALARIRGSRPPVDLRWASETMYIAATAPVGKTELAEIVDVYDASVSTVDEALRRFFAALETRGFFQNALVVVTADHGEEFQEHGARGHGRALFDESIHVPLIVVATDGSRPGAVEHLVSSVDIAPTVLEVAGIPVPLRRLHQVPVEDLRAVRGMGPARVAQLLAAAELGRRLWPDGDAAPLVRGPEQIYDLTRDIRAANREHFVGFYLNSRHQVLRRDIISIGSLNASIVHPREVFRPLIRQAAAAAVVAHNHRSGDSTPSDEDLTLTHRLREAGELVGIPILDHLVIGDRGFCSVGETFGPP